MSVICMSRDDPVAIHNDCCSTPPHHFSNEFASNVCRNCLFSRCTMTDKEPQPDKRDVDAVCGYLICYSTTTFVCHSRIFGLVASVRGGVGKLHPRYSSCWHTEFEMHSQNNSNNFGRNMKNVQYTQMHTCQYMYIYTYMWIYIHIHLYIYKV